MIGLHIMVFLLFVAVALLSVSMILVFKSLRQLAELLLEVSSLCERETAKKCCAQGGCCGGETKNEEEALD